MVHFRHFGHLQISYLQSQFIGMLLVNLRESKEPPAPEGPICSLVWGAWGAPPGGPRSDVLCGGNGGVLAELNTTGREDLSRTGVGFQRFVLCGPHH